MHPVVLFDGVCNYCNAMVNFAINNDPQAQLRFASLQSATGQKLKKAHGVSEDVDSLVLIENHTAYVYGSAALRICKYLRFPAKALYLFSILPGFLINPFYKWVAKNRYKWFGKTETCRVPSSEVRSRFLN